MASNQTSNYGLSQWEATDKVLREEFNQDNAKIDAALAQEKAAREEAVAAVAATVLKVATGTYTGDGAASRTITLSFTPKAVLLCTISGVMYVSSGSGYVYGGLALEGHPVLKATSDGATVTNHTALEIVNNGFRAYCTQLTEYSAIRCNYNGSIYHYIAVG